MGDMIQLKNTISQTVLGKVIDFNKVLIELWENFFNFFYLFFLCSCSGYVNRMYNQLDREEAQIEKRQPRKDDKFTFYRNKGRGLPHLSSKLKEFQLLIRREVDPSIKRQYVPEPEIKKTF